MFSVPTVCMVISYSKSKVWINRVIVKNDTKHMLPLDSISNIPSGNNNTVFTYQY